MLEPRSDGIPTWRSDHIGERMMMKLPAQFKEIFVEKKSLDESIGNSLAAWARGDELSVTEWDAALDEAAKLGTTQLRIKWATVPRTLKTTLKTALEVRHKPTATQVDTKAPT